MRLLMIVHGRVERPRDRRVERPSETSARHSFALCVLLVYMYLCYNKGNHTHLSPIWVIIVRIRRIRLISL